jgi:hypothetical protein
MMARHSTNLVLISKNITHAKPNEMMVKHVYITVVKHHNFIGFRSTLQRLFLAIIQYISFQL